MLSTVGAAKLNKTANVLENLDALDHAAVASVGCKSGCLLRIIWAILFHHLFQQSQSRTAGVPGLVFPALDCLGRYPELFGEPLARPSDAFPPSLDIGPGEF